MTTHDGRLAPAERVLETLRRAGADPVSYGQIIARTGLAKSQLNSALGTLMDNRRIQQAGRGLYKLREP